MGNNFTKNQENPKKDDAVMMFEEDKEQDIVIFL